MSQVVQPSRLAKRRRYPGFQYQHIVKTTRGDVESRPARAVELTGAEWQALIAGGGLRLETVAGDAGCLHAYLGAELRYEIHEGLAAWEAA